MCLINSVLSFIRYRRDILEGEENIRELVRDMIVQVVQDMCMEYHS